MRRGTGLLTHPVVAILFFGAGLGIGLSYTRPSAPDLPGGKPTVAVSPAGTQPAPVPSPARVSQVPAAPLTEPVLITGMRTRSSKPIALPAGNYTIDWKCTPILGGNFIARLAPVLGNPMDGVAIANLILEKGAPQSGQTQAYNLADGQYYVLVIGDGSWSVSISPLG